MDLTLLAYSYGAVIGSILIALAYMLGKALNSQKMLAYARTEIGELIFSAVLLVIIIFALSNTDSLVRAVSPSDFGSSALDAQTVIYSYMELPLEGAIEAMARSSMRLSKLVSYNYNYNTGVPYVGGPWGSASPGSGGAPLQLALTTGIDTSAATMFLSSALKIVFVFLYTVSAFIFIPLGVFLRFLPVTRQIGSLLLAISIAVTFAFPASVFWSAKILGSDETGFDASRIVPDEDNTDWLKTLICNAPLRYVNTLGEDVIGNIAGYIVCLVSGGTVCAGHTSPAEIPIPDAVSGVHGWVQFGVWLGKKIASIAGSLAASSFGPEPEEILKKGFDPTIGYIMPMVIERNMRALLMALFQLIATMAIAKNLSQSFGAEGQFYGLSKMV